MTLSKRLLTVASLIREGSFIADVGSDHAQLPLFLLKTGRICGAETIENKKGPYSRMEKAVLASPFSSSIILSFSDGIASLDPKVDTVVIAGMGGREILKILQAHPEALKNVNALVIDAHSERESLFSALGNLGYRVTSEVFFYDMDIPYDVFRAEKTPDHFSYSWKECLFGPLNIIQPSKDFLLYWGQEKKRLESLLKLEGLSAKNHTFYEREIAAIKEAIHEH